ncbi:hypothetical protein Y032_0034g2828 [Ancylostoma ceylanicum]|uniref:Calpain catalytic domain-containing protein n=1 Tax=Ancylostoma ceylanicum TaxID=53326 RepID=A0A016ULV4_9BILA|nr:hypothetical protein Y032_0034g2828 [Ancylostoma ceylanicum]
MFKRQILGKGGVRHWYLVSISESDRRCPFLSLTGLSVRQPLRRVTGAIMSDDESTYEDEQEEYEEGEKNRHKPAKDNNVVEQEDGESDQDADDDEENVESDKGADDDDDPVMEKRTIVPSTKAAKRGQKQECGGTGCSVEGALDGFGGSSYDDIIEALSELVDDEGGLSNFISSGDMKSTVDKMLDEAALNFIGLDLETGAILSAIAGNTIFNVGGRDNALSNIGKIILDNIISGKFKKDVQPFVPPGGGKTGLNFYEERKKCLSNKVLFEDPEFPATDRSISNEEIGEKIEWKRPSEIVEDPQFIVGQTSRFDVKQNALGDCWLLAAIANLTLRDELFFRVVPPDQSFTQDYAGIFHFHFWRYGKWVDVVIDDRLPMLNGKLYSLHSQENNEFWSALLEKAYAKLYGSYENLEGGFTAEALEDFTGGLTESYILRNTEKSILLAVMVRGFQMGSLFGCGTEANPNEDENAESVMDNGLVFGHAYSVTALILVKDSSQGNNLLVRIRNPWGDTEWNGAWSDDSPEWNAVDSKERAQLKVKYADDGEFWMSFDDFCKNFEELEICNLSASVMNEISEMTGVSVCELQKHQWEEHAQDGDWNMAKGTAGGNLSNPDTFAKNPQFGARFIVSEDSVEKDGKCTVIVAVLQKYRREMRPAGKENLEIGFYVYEVEWRDSDPFVFDRLSRNRRWLTIHILLLSGISTFTFLRERCQT